VDGVLNDDGSQPQGIDLNIFNGSVEDLQAYIARSNDAVIRQEPTPTTDQISQLSSNFKLVYFSQHDPRWQNAKVGNGNEAIGDWGSLLTSLAMLLNGHGYDETPLTLNEKLKEAGGFQGSLLIPSVLPSIYPNVKYNDMVASESTPAPIAQIDASLVAGQPVLVQVDGSSEPGIQTEFVLVYARKGDDYLMLDPTKAPSKEPNEDLLLESYGQGLTLEEAISATLFFEIAAP
jgi:hypothetical protein